MADWYYVDAANAQAGPASPADFARLYASGTITDTTLVWKDGQPGWEALSAVASLYAQVKAPPPVPTRGGAPPLPSKPGVAVAARGGVSQFPEQASRLSGRSLAALSKGANWQEKRTADGVPYYWNPSSESVTWDKPDSLKSPEELEQGSADWVWVRDDGGGGWAPARLLKGGGDSASVSVQMQSGQKRTVKRGKDEPLWPLKPSSLNHVPDDLVMVDDINQGLMVHCLQSRYRKDEIYTWVGANHSVLVSINPFKQLPIYTAGVIAEYAKPSAYRPPPPHTFAIANSAYERLCQENRSQAILISGESGAGKTEATKQCFNFLADVAGSSNNVEQRILYANPLLEAFGNAKTLRNNNSSRFGRWTEVHFDPRSQICGARIENYLLEKQRVVSQARGERNYHIFYQLCNSEAGQILQLSSPEAFRFLRESGCITVPGINDRKDFAEVEEALAQLGFSLEEKCWSYETCAGILHLGNVSFAANGEGSRVDHAGENALQMAAHYLKVAPADLAQALTTRTIEVRGDVTRALNSPAQAMNAADALAKALYDSMFDWLVGRINLAVHGEMSARFIGVLDIFGFEIFEKNHFEQLCINYTNEKLQQHFNKHTFTEEESVYAAEQIRFNHVEFVDNQPVVDLIEKKPYGLMPLLDEEVKVPKGADLTWLAKSKQHNAAHPCLQNAGNNPNRFIVKHYAGDVTYDSNGFVETNKDYLFRDLYDLMTSSGAAVSKQLFPPKDNNPRRITTLGEKFRKALADLMAATERCEPWYIRCIKPNDQKAANSFDAKMCVEQLTYAGVFEAVQIRKSGYPFRLPHRRFANRYRVLAYKEGGWTNLGCRPTEHRRMSEALLRCVNQDFSRIQIGNTMVLYRAEEHRILELLRNLCLERVIPVAQRAARRKINRKFRRYMREAKTICSRALRTSSNDAHALEAALRSADAIAAPVRVCYGWEPWEMRRCRELHFALQERVQLTATLQALCQRDPVQCYSELRVAIARLNKIRDIPGTPEQMALEQRARGLLHQASAAKIDPIAQEALAILERRMMEDIVKEAEAVEYDSANIAEVRRKLALPEEEFVKLQLEVARQLNDPERVINREIKLKEMYLDANGALFSLDKFPGLRTAEDWAALKKMKTFAFTGSKQENLAAGFLKHTAEPIHKSLTVVSGLKGEAVKQFKNLLGYCGDRKYQYPDALLPEIVRAGLANESLRPELYAQCMKQLADNPQAASAQRCWEAVAMLLSCFPPPPDCENWVHQFVRTQAPAETREKFKLAAHKSHYDGARPTAPTDKETPQMLSAFFNREISPRYNVEEDVVAVRPALPPPSRPGWAVQAVGGTPAAAATVGGYGGGYGSAQPVGYEASGAAVGAGYGASSGYGNGNGASSNGFAHAPALAPPPLPPKPPSGPTARVLYDYDPAGQEGMIAVSAGQVIRIKSKDDDAWWMAEVDGESGWVPAAYVEMLS